MFQISPKWNAFALSFLCNRKNLPAINLFEWNSDSGLEYLTIRIPFRYRDFFGGARWSGKVYGSIDINQVRLHTIIIVFYYTIFLLYNHYCFLL